MYWVLTFRSQRSLFILSALSSIYVVLNQLGSNIPHFLLEIAFDRIGACVACAKDQIQPLAQTVDEYKIQAYQDTIDGIYIFLFLFSSSGVKLLSKQTLMYLLNRFSGIFCKPHLYRLISGQHSKVLSTYFYLVIGLACLSSSLSKNTDTAIDVVYCSSVKLFHYHSRMRNVNFTPLQSKATLRNCHRPEHWSTGARQ